MFGLIRLIIGCVFFSLVVLAIKKSKSSCNYRKYIISAIVTVVFVTLSAFIPIENAFITFPSAESVYKYVSFGNNVKLTVDGQNSDLVIGDKNGSNEYLIVPKISGGWKIGGGLNTKKVAQTTHDGIVIYIYQYKNTSDYFITILDTKNETTEIADSCDSEFIFLKENSSSYEESVVTYYANIQELDKLYWVSVNGEKISNLVG